MIRHSDKTESSMAPSTIRRYSMASKIDKSESSKFMLASHDDLSQNVIHIESQRRFKNEVQL
jgi:hypothetical protein